MRETASNSTKIETKTNHTTAPSTFKIHVRHTLRRLFDVTSTVIIEVVIRAYVLNNRHLKHVL